MHTLGRFIFAPLLPYFINDGMLTAQQGAQLATLNYAGYMVGEPEKLGDSHPM
ncbi:YbfB/YjiJ family MFS transporter [Alkalilimnicola ehrlichii]|uniref:Uncharacterized protein n=1 Tax=Alkalilimnicola ehrlichii TaxID=351052 RepID=A0A3E0WG07_9GAMM|nr:hypothetical protein CAL65_22855 [Alkalilimnicola ehrlichii]